MKFFIILLLVGIMNPTLVHASTSALSSTIVKIPGGDDGIGFDDLNFSSSLHSVLVPAGHTGKLYLIDPVTFGMKSIGGFSSSLVRKKGEKIGISSVDEGDGVLFVGDHGKKMLDAIDAKSGVVIASVGLVEDYDFLRYVGTAHEIWVTEPDKRQIEVVKFTGLEHPQLTLEKIISLPDEPESLIIDQTRGRAYTNLGPTAVSIDLTTYVIDASWQNECQKSRGDALDEKNGFLFISCSEGKAVVFDLNHQNKEISKLTTDPGVDVISYNPKLSHLYFTSGKNASLSIIGVSSQGKLSLLGKAQADQRSHCVVSDDQNNIWVCDPPRGQLLRYKDSL